MQRRFRLHAFILFRKAWKSTQIQQNTSIQKDTEENPESSYTASLGINKDKGEVYTGCWNFY